MPKGSDEREAVMSVESFSQGDDRFPVSRVPRKHSARLLDRGSYSSNKTRID